MPMSEWEEYCQSIQIKLCNISKLKSERIYDRNCRKISKVIKMTLKSNIGELIDKSPYKREYIMKKFNKSRNTISNWCTGKSYPSIPEMYELAEILDVNPADLYEKVKGE